MSAGAPEATAHDSRGIATPGFVGVLRIILALTGAAGVLLLVVSTFSTVIEIKVLTSSDLASKLDTDLTGGDRHGVAMLLAALFGAVMLGGGVVRGARPAMAGVAAAGVLALAIAIASDAHHIHDTGQVGDVYEDARADAGPGFFQETLGGALLLISGGGLLLFAGAAASITLPKRSRRAAAPAADVTLEEPDGGARADDWWSS